MQVDDHIPTVANFPRRVQCRENISRESDLVQGLPMYPVRASVHFAVEVLIRTTVTSPFFRYPRGWVSNSLFMRRNRCVVFVGLVRDEQTNVDAGSGCRTYWSCFRPWDDSNDMASIAARAVTETAATPLRFLGGKHRLRRRRQGRDSDQNFGGRKACEGAPGGSEYGKESVECRSSLGLWVV